jgi:histidine triad (HIT) family protein
MMTTDCLFCRIARREIPAEIVHEDDDILAFLDIRPIRPGHTLVIPKRHFPYFEALPPDFADAITRFGQRLATAMKHIYEVPRVAFLFTGTDIAHAHAHIVPMVAPGDITSRHYIAEEKVTFKTPPRRPAAELVGTAEALRAALRETRDESASN